MTAGQKRGKQKKTKQTRKKKRPFFEKRFGWLRDVGFILFSSCLVLPRFLRDFFIGGYPAGSAFAGLFLRRGFFRFRERVLPSGERDRNGHRFLQLALNGDVPPCSSTIFWQILRPSPELPRSRERCLLMR